MSFPETDSRPARNQPLTEDFFLPPLVKSHVHIKSRAAL